MAVAVAGGVGKAFGKSVAAVAAAAAAALLALNGARLISVPSRVLLGAIVTSAVLAALTTSGAAWGEWRERKTGTQRDAAEFQLSATLWAVVDQVSGNVSGNPSSGPAALDYRDLGLAVYALRRRWWWPFSTRLVRRHRVRASRRPATSDVTWTPGKGVIGTCVSGGSIVGIDLTDLYDSLGDPTAEDWASAPADITMGLSYPEYLDLRGKYEVVVALPIVDDRGATTKVRGCVALDGPRGQLPQLSSVEVTDLLTSLVQGLLRQAG